MNKLSIIIPAYNAEKWIISCIQSALGSYSGDLEVICVDDGSTDSTFELINCTFRKDFRVKCIHQSNQGRCIARNKGIECASGDYITFLDADDKMVPSAMDECVSAMCSGATLVCTIGRDDNCLEVNGADGDRPQASPKEIELLSKEALAFLLNCDYEIAHNEGISPFAGSLSKFNSFWCSTVFTKIFRAEQIRSSDVGFVPGLRFGEDILFLYDYLVNQDSRVVFLPVETYVYNTSNAGTIRRYRSGDADALKKTIGEWYKRFWDSNFKQQIAACVTRNVLFLATRAFNYCPITVALAESGDLLTNDSMSEILRYLDVNRLVFSESRLRTIWISAAKDLSAEKKIRLLTKLCILGAAQRIKRS